MVSFSVPVHTRSSYVCFGTSWTGLLPLRGRSPPLMDQSSGRREHRPAWQSVLKKLNHKYKGKLPEREGLPRNSVLAEQLGIGDVISQRR